MVVSSRIVSDIVSDLPITKYSTLYRPLPWLTLSNFISIKGSLEVKFLFSSALSRRRHTQSTSTDFYFLLSFKSLDP